MRPGGGKGKGSGYEREIGYILSLWMSKGVRKDLLCRTVGSGAQFTSAARRQEMMGIPGDLRSQHEISDDFCKKFVIECKFWADLEIDNFLVGKGELYKAVLKVAKEGTDLNKEWMLICKQNHKPSWIIIKHDETFFPRMFALPKYPVVCHRLFHGFADMFLLEEFVATIPLETLLGVTDGSIITTGTS